MKNVMSPRGQRWFQVGESGSWDQMLQRIDFKNKIGF